VIRLCRNEGIVTVSSAKEKISPLTPCASLPRISMDFAGNKYPRSKILPSKAVARREKPFCLNFGSSWIKLIFSRIGRCRIEPAVARITFHYTCRHSPYLEERHLYRTNRMSAVLFPMFPGSVTASHATIRFKDLTSSPSNVHRRCSTRASTPCG